MNIGIDIDNTLTEIQEQLDKAVYDYAIQLGKNVKRETEPIEDTKNNGDTLKEKFGFTRRGINLFF